MRSSPSVGAVNLALVSLYFAPVWGRESIRTLLSPYSGFDDRGHSAIVMYVREVFNFGLDGLMRVSNLLAGFKLVVAAGFAAYLVEFARAVAVGREINRETADGVLALGTLAVVLLVLPALGLDDPALVRRAASQLMLIAGAVVVITLEPRDGERITVVSHPVPESSRQSAR